MSFFYFLKVSKLQNQGTGIKGKEMALVRQEKASRTALQTSTAN